MSGDRPPGVAAWEAARDILVVRLDNLGDVLMATPAMTALSRNGTRRLTLLASPSGVVVEPHVPALHDAIAWNAPWVKGRADDPADDRRLLLRLMRRRFDAAVIFTTCTQSALPAASMCRLAGIPLRLAYSRENPYAVLSDFLPETDIVGPGMRHEVRRQLDLVRSVGFDTGDARLVFDCTPSDRESVRRVLAALGLAATRPYVVVHPGSTAASRRYPAQRFGQAAARIAEASGAAIVFAGGEGDVGACAEAQRAMGAASFTVAGALRIGELAALIEGAAGLVCNNSGPAHLAAAVGTPCVVLYALTNPQHTPWRVPQRVLNVEVPCRDCLKSVCPARHHACLLGVPAAEVAAAALDLFVLAPMATLRLTRPARPADSARSPEQGVEVPP